MESQPQPCSREPVALIPMTGCGGPALNFDFPAVQVGIAAYEAGPTGCTVFSFPREPVSVIDVRGALPGTLAGTPEEDLRTAAICFAGGSVYGHAAAMGVAAELFARSDHSEIKLVRGAILWDFWRTHQVCPDEGLGRAALNAARAGVFPLGPAGAGVSACCAGERAGQGGAFRQVGPTKIAVFTVVNALGAIVDREGRVVRGNRGAKSGRRHHYRELLEERIHRQLPAQPESGKNTTLTLVVTNQRLGHPRDPRSHLRQLARQVHSSMARAIQPFHTADDGDVLFAVSTNEVENEVLSTTDVGVFASELAWDAVLSCFSAETP